MLSRGVSGQNTWAPQLIIGRSCDLKGLVFTYPQGKYTKPGIPFYIRTAPVTLRLLPKSFEHVVNSK
jgi:hypothetical protein